MHTLAICFENVRGSSIFMVEQSILLSYFMKILGPKGVTLSAQTLALVLVCHYMKFAYILPANCVLGSLCTLEESRRGSVK